MTDAELFAWAVCHGWRHRRGGAMIELIAPDGRVFDLGLDRDRLPVLDDWSRAAISLHFGETMHRDRHRA